MGNLPLFKRQWMRRGEWGQLGCGRGVRWLHYSNKIGSIWVRSVPLMRYDDQFFPYSEYLKKIVDNDRLSSREISHVQFSSEVHSITSFTSPRCLYLLRTGKWELRVRVNYWQRDIIFELIYSEKFGSPLIKHGRGVLFGFTFIR